MTVVSLEHGLALFGSPQGCFAGSRPGGRGTFLCFAKAKYPKERRAGFVGPALRCGHAALLGLSGVRTNSLRSDMCAPFSAQSCATRLLITAGETEYRIPNSTRTRHGASLFELWLLCLHRRYEEASSAGVDGSGLALSERSEFSQTPADPSNAAYPRFARGDESGSPSLCVLSLGEARESESPAGARPGKAAPPGSSPHGKNIGAS
jgi:hypothetical protein